MIEEEAKNKLCPILAIAVIPTVFSLELKEARDKLTEEMRCQASDCMMWQATDNEWEPRQFNNNPTVPDPEPKCYPAGYCGLAGVIK